MESDTNRRSFLAWAIFAIGAVFSAVIGVPIVCYAIDPRHRKGAKSTFKLVDGIKLDDEALIAGSPKQGVIRDVRVDGWTLYPNDVIGRVWVLQRGPRPDLSTPEKVEEFNKSTAALKQAYLAVFTTICPHLGCSVNLNNAGNGFACPCHAATFKLDGDRADDSNPAKRGMDTLEWNIDDTDPAFNRIVVAYRNFEPSKDQKIVVGESAEA